jgi:CHASE2 domain-containing sensor protein
MGALIALGAFGHSFMGRLEVDQELGKFPIAFDVDSMLYVTWYFVGGCMALFGLTIVWAWWRLRRGETTLLGVTGLIGALYVATGLGGFLYRHRDPFMLMFLLEGALLLLCSTVLHKRTPLHV